MFIVFSSLLGACGDSGFSTGLPSDKSLGTLNPAEAAQLCAATKTYVDGKAQLASCQFGAVVTALAQGSTDTDGRMICRKQLDTCLAMPPAHDIDTVNCKAPQASCMATVGEYETCLNDVAGDYDNRIAKLPSCDTLTLSRSSLPPITLIPPKTPPSCNTVASKCPDIYIPTTSSAAGKQATMTRSARIDPTAIVTPHPMKTVPAQPRRLRNCRPGSGPRFSISCSTTAAVST